MTSVLNLGGLNFGRSNPIRHEFVAIHREMDQLRKQVELLTDENQIFRKYIMKLTQLLEDGAGQAEFTHDIMSLSKDALFERPQAGINTVQGGGFRR